MSWKNWPSWLKGGVIGLIILGILSTVLFFPLSYLEADKPWTEERHDGICPLHPFQNQYVSDKFPGYFPTGDKTSCERALEKNLITGDGQVFGGSMVCYNNVLYETNWKCITPLLYYPIFNLLQPGAAELQWLVVIPLFIYGTIIGFIAGIIISLIVGKIKSKNKGKKKK